MGKWTDDGQVDLWAYPRNCSDLWAYNQSCVYLGELQKTPSFNPQGFVFTFAGNGSSGFADGDSATSMFNFPEDVAADDYGYVYVADTGNNAIRMITPFGNVITIAGKGSSNPGFNDGPCKTATFTLPKGLDAVRNITSGKVAIVVADTGNHRIRMLNFGMKNGSSEIFDCVVTCLTGLCGNNTLSATDYHFRATPQTGYADGSGLVARFSSPQSVTFFMDAIVVADTGNFLIRWVTLDGNTSTLAGTVIQGETDAEGRPAAGCAPPCLAGQP